MLELSAQKLQPSRDIIFGYVDMIFLPEIATIEGALFDGTIYVYMNGVQLTFYGHRTSTVLIRFIEQLKPNPHVTLETRQHIRAFEDIDKVKVIAFYDKNKTGYKYYIEASKHFQPYITFYVVHNEKLANHMNLRSSGSIFVYKPHQKKVKLAKKQVSSCADIINFIHRNSRPVLKQLTMDDLHYVWMMNPKSKLYVAFIGNNSTTTATRATTAIPFFTILKKLAQSYENNEDITFVWIDPQSYPSMKDYWALTYSVDIQVPSIGSLNMTTRETVWFNMTSLAPIRSDVKTTVKQIRFWINDKNISTQPGNATTPAGEPAIPWIN
ncbi:calsequestrin-2-like [Tubulanus polymorphus]|uniref:calsequestrin-2-like n=1 Tax=Tubulanus polymorphus TaxID=672921 RepID=UPI003DA492AA